MTPNIIYRVIYRRYFFKKPMPNVSSNGVVSLRSRVKSGTGIKHMASPNSHSTIARHAPSENVKILMKNMQKLESKSKAKKDEYIKF